MAGPNLTTHLPIVQIYQKAGNTPYTSAQPEKAGQTFPIGSPVQLSGGYVQVWDGVTVTAGILGVSENFGSNLATSGAGAPVPPFGQITGSQAIQTWGSVQNEPNAVNIALATPMTDGRTLYMEPNNSNVFQALFDDSTGTTAANWTPAQTDIGTNFGLTVDASGFWYVDRAKTGTSAVLQLVGLPFGSYLNAPVSFVFLPSAIQVI